MSDSPGSQGDGDRSNAPPEQHQTPASPELHELRVSIARIVGKYFLPLLLLTLSLAVFLIFIIGTKYVADETVEKMALAASVQVAFGMVVGYVCVYIGLMMTWFGIEAAYSVKGSVGAQEAKGELSLQSASPGLLFALGGMILIAVCLYKPIVYEAKAPFHSVPLTPPDANKKSADSEASDTEIKPDRPPPFGETDNSG